MKRCTECGVEKPLEEFTKDKRKRDRRSTRCKVCHRAMSAEWRAKNPSYLHEHYLARRPKPSRPLATVIDGQKACTKCGQMKLLRAFNKRPDGVGGRASHCRDCHRRAYRENPAPHREKARKQRQKHPTYMSEWRARNPEKVAASHLLRNRQKANRWGLSLEYLETVIAEIRALPCHYCGGSGGEVDHIVPLARGGPDHPQNYYPACRACNAAKRTKLLHEWDGPSVTHVA